MKDPNHQARLKELRDTSSWERAAYIEKGGWDRMPGEDKASYTVSRACADGLEVLVKKIGYYGDALGASERVPQGLLPIKDAPTNSRARVSIVE
jgi:hypothetical protein